MKLKRSPLQSYLCFVLCILNQTIVLKAECNICNAQTNTSCVSETEFQQCEDNVPFGNIFKCNEGYYCSILGGCTVTKELRDCQLCGKCDERKTYACTGTQTFALCLGTDVPSEITGRCTNDLKCNINDRNICGNSISTCSFRDDPIPDSSTSSTTTETTTTTTTTTTTPSPAQDPNAFCRLIKKEGRYPIGTNPETTCRQFLRCIHFENVWYSPIYNCPGQTYFDSSRNDCVVDRPSICAGTITGLSFRNIYLE